MTRSDCATARLRGLMTGMLCLYVSLTPLATLAQTMGLTSAPVRVVLAAPPVPDAEAMGRKVLAAVMLRAQLSYQLTVEPSGRALVSWAAGRYDLDLARAVNFDSAAPGSHIVRPHLFTVQLTAYGLQPRVIKGWHDVLPLRIAYNRGATLVELRLREALHARQVNSREACIGMVVRGHVDLCITANAPMLPLPKTPNDVVLHGTPLERLDYFMWAAPDQRALAEHLSQTLQAMLQSGELQKVAGGDRLL